MNKNTKTLFGFIALVGIGLLMLMYVPKEKTKSSKRTELLLDTYVTITVANENNKTKEAMRLAFSRMSEIEDKLNRYDKKSEISKINEAAPKPVVVSEDTFRAVKVGLAYSKKSKGAFDITIGPLVDLYNFNKKKVPSTKKISEAKKLVNWRYVKTDEKRRKISLLKKGMILDLGGLAKGFAADEARIILKQNKQKEGLIDTGSSALTFGKNGSKPWKVGVKHPRKDEILTVLSVADKNVSTSGDYQQYFIKSGRRYHHIINPKTGLPASNIVSVTVVSDKSAAESDILSTAIFVLGKKEGLKLIKNIKNTHFIMISADGNTITTSKKFNIPSRIKTTKK